jgi:hypothetical protein
MNKKIKNIKSIYPLLIIADRYTGCYSWWKYLAINKNVDEITSDLFKMESDDMECSDFWKNRKEWDYPIWKWNSINEALKNLYTLIKK